MVYPILGLAFGYPGVDLGEVLVAGRIEKDAGGSPPAAGSPSAFLPRASPLNRSGFHKNLYLKLNFNFILRDFLLPVNPWFLLNCTQAPA